MAGSRPAVAAVAGPWLAGRRQERMTCKLEALSTEPSHWQPITRPFAVPSNRAPMLPRKAFPRKCERAVLRHVDAGAVGPVYRRHSTDQPAITSRRCSVARPSFTNTACCSTKRCSNCYDNGVAESSFATLKKELVHGCAFETRSEAYDAISDHIKTTRTRKAATWR